MCLCLYVYACVVGRVFFFLVVGGHDDGFAFSVGLEHLPVPLPAICIEVGAGFIEQEELAAGG